MPGVHGFRRPDDGLHDLGLDSTLRIPVHHLWIRDTSTAQGRGLESHMVNPSTERNNMSEKLRPMNEMEARGQFINNTPLHQKPWFKLKRWLRYSWHQQWIYDLSIQEREIERRHYIFALGVLKR
jgi:hypothetical protein